MQIPEVFKKHHVSLSEVARRIGVSKGTLSDSVRRGNMYTDTLRKMAKAAGCNISEFFADEDNPNNEIPQEANKSKFTALIDAGGQLYRADGKEAVKAIISELRQSADSETSVKSIPTGSKATTKVFRSSMEVKEYVQVLCERCGIKNAYAPYLCMSFAGNYDFGIVFAVDADKNVIAATPFWRNQNGAYEVQNELVRVNNMALVRKVPPFRERE